MIVDLERGVPRFATERQERLRLGDDREPWRDEEGVCRDANHVCMNVGPLSEARRAVPVREGGSSSRLRKLAMPINKRETFYATYYILYLLLIGPGIL